MIWSRAIRGLWIVASLLPAIAVLHQIVAKSPNIPLGDQWSGSVVTVLRAAEGSLRPADIFEWHTVHRPAFSRALALLLAQTSHWDLRIEASISVVISLVSLLLVFRLLPARLGSARYLLLPVIALLLFTLRASWVRSWHNAWHFARFFWLAAVAVVALRAPSWRRLLSSGLFVACATFSQGVGALLWPLGFGYLWAARYRKLANHLCWLCLGAVVLTCYYQGFRLPHYLSGRETESSVLERLEFVGAFLGGPLVAHRSDDVALAVVLGIAGLGLLAVDCWWHRRQGGELEEIAPWLAMCGFALGIATLTSLGRAGMGLVHATNDRYVIVAALFWIGLLGIAALALCGEGRAAPGSGKRVHALNVLLLAICTILFARAYLESARQAPEVSPAEKACFLAFPKTRDLSCMDRLQRQLRLSSRAGADAIPGRIDALARHRLTLFAVEPSPDSQGGR